MIHHIDGHILRFSPIRICQMFLIHHCPCHLKYMPVLSFGYSILLRCVLACKLPPNSFLSKVCCEGVGEVLFTVIRSKTLNMSIGCLFDLVFELLAVSEHFALLSHRVDPSVSREVVDDRYIVSATTKCCHLGCSPYI